MKTEQNMLPPGVEIKSEPLCETAEADTTELLEIKGEGGCGQPASTHQGGPLSPAHTPNVSGTTSEYRSWSPRRSRFSGVKGMPRETSPNNRLHSQSELYMDAVGAGSPTSQDPTQPALRSIQASSACQSPGGQVGKRPTSWLEQGPSSPSVTPRSRTRTRMTNQTLTAATAPSTITHPTDSELAGKVTQEDTVSSTDVRDSLLRPSRASPRKQISQELMPRLRKEIDLSPKRPAVAISPERRESVSVRPIKQERGKEMPTLHRELSDASKSGCDGSNCGTSSSCTSMDDSEDSIVDVVTIASPVQLEPDCQNNEEDELKIAFPGRNQDVAELCPHWTDMNHNQTETETSEDSRSSFENIDYASSARVKAKRRRIRVNGHSESDAATSWQTPAYRSGFETKVHTPPKSFGDRYSVVPTKRTKRKYQETQYDAELIEQRGWKVPKITIRIRRDPALNSSSNSQGSLHSTKQSDTMAGVFSSYVVGKSIKKKKGKRKDRKRGVSDSQIYARSPQNGIHTDCFYTSPVKSDSGLSPPGIKRLRIKYGGINTINIPYTSR